VSAVAEPERTDIAALYDHNLEDLRAAWARHYGAPPPLRSPHLLRLMLAWRLQADTYGGLDHATRRKLARNGPVQPEGMELGVGTILARSWQGQRVEVIVEQQGFRHNGRLYPSLSAAASAIAGSRWNGPRFFGLRSAPGTAS